MIKYFNIRVYGIYLNQNSELLICGESFKGMQLTKFPGGGLHPGEGTIDCLKREIFEETGQEIVVKDHFYTTDFFQKAMFFEDQQLISIYYYFDFKEPLKFDISGKAPQKDQAGVYPIYFRLEKLGSLEESDFTLPIDQIVFRKLKEVHQK